MLHRNFRRAGGEIDLIMALDTPLGNRALVFVEVKCRQRPHYGGPVAAVTARKRARLIRTASAYVAEHPYVHDWPWRFDVVTILGSANAGELNWIERAF